MFEAYFLELQSQQIILKKLTKLCSLHSFIYCSKLILLNNASDSKTISLFCFSLVVLFHIFNAT